MKQTKGIILFIILTQLCTAFLFNQPETKEYYPNIRPFDTTKNKTIITGKWREKRLAGHEEYYHNGIDYSLPLDTEIIASGKGKVIVSRYTKGYGNLIVIDHGTWWDKESKGYVSVQSYYAHLSEYLVLKGAEVTRGQAIGLCGNTGRSTNNHIHFEIRINEKPNWPGYFMRQKNRELKLLNKHI